MNNEEWRNDDLLQALTDFRTNQTPENESRFINNLTTAVFIAPVTFSIEPVQNEAGELEVPEDSEMRLVTFQNEEGHGVFPIFTDMTAFQAQEIEADDNLYSWPMTIADYLPIFQNPDSQDMDGLALNPFTDGMPITRENLAFIAGAGQTAAAGSENADMQLTDTDELPTPLLSELIGLADDSRGAVETIWVLWLQNDETGLANYLLVVDGPDGEAVKALFPDFAQAFAQKADAGLENVDMILKADFDVDLSEFQPKYTR